MLPGPNYKLGFALSGNQHKVFKVIDGVFEKYPQGLASKTLCKAVAVVLKDQPGNISSTVSILMRNKLLAIAA